MERAVQLHAQGKSLREIAETLRASHETVRRDLARWRATLESSNVVQLVSHSAVTFTPSPGANVTPECDSNRRSS